MRVLTVVGARPQFVKAAVVSRALARAGVDETLVHTGQHYDANMSQVFFDDLEIPPPAHSLEVGSGGHGFQTGETMKRLEPVCQALRPDAVLVYGDTNATLAGALVAAKLVIPLGHVEAGLRSFDRSMPEEVNRVVADHVSTWLFCPTETAVSNLAAEGLTRNVHCVGDVMYDSVLRFRGLAERKSTILNRLSLENRAFVLATIHRGFNTDDPVRLTAIVDGFIACGMTVVFPAHPRVRKQLTAYGLRERLERAATVMLVEPVGYLDMIRLEASARAIVTDSGGVQKEAFFMGVPCITVRPSTEWVETVELGWNRLLDADAVALAAALRAASPPPPTDTQPFGDGHAADAVAGVLV